MTTTPTPRERPDRGSQDLPRRPRRTARRRDPPRRAHDRGHRRRARRRCSTATSTRPNASSRTTTPSTSSPTPSRTAPSCCSRRQQPLANDLRFLVTVMRVAHELERSADLMVNVAKTTRRLYPHQLDPKLRGIIDRMGAQASNQTAGRHRRVRRRRPALGRRARRHGRRDGRAHQEPVPPHPRGRRQRRGHGAARGADGVGGTPLRADRRPRRHDRRAGRLHGDRRAPGARAARALDS